MYKTGKGVRVVLTIALIVATIGILGINKPLLGNHKRKHVFNILKLFQFPFYPAVGVGIIKIHFPQKYPLDTPAQKREIQYSISLNAIYIIHKTSDNI